jgi:hypothetical protein
LVYRDLFWLTAFHALTAWPNAAEVAFIRRVRTASGATGYRSWSTWGSARTKAELGALLERPENSLRILH